MWLNIIWLLILSQIPIFLFLTYVYVRDHQEKEPFHLLLKTFALGCLATPIAIGLETVIGRAIGYKTGAQGPELVIYAFLGAALVEEGLKYIVLRYYCYPKAEFNEPYDGIMYSATVSLGFAALENLGFVLLLGHEVAFIRMITAVPLHLITGVFMGFSVGRAKFAATPTKSKILLWQGFTTAFIVHGVYDVSVFQNDRSFIPISLAFLAAQLFLVWKAIRLHNRSA